MTVWVYGFVPAGVTGLPLPAGVGDQPVRLLGVGSAAAAASTLTDAGPALERVLSHERVAEALLATGAVLPARFGSTLRGDAEVHDLLRALADRLPAALSRVQGRVELALRVHADAVTPPPAPTPSSGREWIARRLAERDDDARLQQEVHAVLAQEANDARWWPARPDGTPARASYLVPVATVEAFRVRQRELALALGRRRVAMTCTGPWPPYSFSDLEAA